MSTGISRRLVQNSSLALAFGGNSGLAGNEDNRQLENERAGRSDLQRSSEKQRAIQAKLNRLSASNVFQQVAQADTTVEQAQKNIKVLSGLPESQLLPVMNFISTSLGVRCTHCHVNKNNNWDFASDEKPEKQTAREMIKMVQGINKTTFRSNTAGI